MCPNCQATEHAERRAREDAEKRAREDAERRAREDAERRIKEEVERRVQEEMKRKEREEAERSGKEEAEKRGREEEMRREKEEAERRRREEEEKKEKEEMKKEARTSMSEWMEKKEFGKLQKKLRECKQKAVEMFEGGELPVVGWLQLSEKMESRNQQKNELEEELDAKEREQQEIQQQIRNLEERKQQLEQSKQQIQEQIKKNEEIDVLESERDIIATLARKEQLSLQQLNEKMENANFINEDNGDFMVGELIFEDVSTVFSMFKMDAMFSRFRNYDPSCNLDTILNSTVDDLQINLKLEFKEAVEILFKIKLLEKKEKGAERHLKACSICKANKIGVLLKEYGLPEKDLKQIEDKSKDWKGFYLATLFPSMAAKELEGGSELISCLARIQRRHKWKLGQN